MTYYCGIGAGLAALVGMPERSIEPTLCCDIVGCGARLTVRPVRGGAPAWLRSRKAPRGWKRWPQPNDQPAQHSCPRCTKDLGRGVDIAFHKK